MYNTGHSYIDEKMEFYGFLKAAEKGYSIARYIDRFHNDGDPIKGLKSYAISG
ncbi:5904_t:CDS:2 [Diversispora eburnea]|uniref:5904_t:CDS:1 n=1 Tax=Diversispora eburnea TaxID=1213867 RepID=A0A9N8W1D5_9GLOM|nr:5904_t:CDS:2 [Diversispora eburnea]